MTAATTLPMPLWAVAALTLLLIVLVVLLVRKRPARLGESPPEASGARRAASQTLSHEIRTPLTLVKGAAELLAEESPGPLNEQQRYFLDTIQQNTQHVIDLAENFLLDVRLSKQDPKLDLQDVEVRELVRETVQELRRVHKTRIRLESLGEPLQLRADRQLLRQVLWNLLNNAARHAGKSPSGNAASVTVWVRGGSEGVTVAVEDDGQGMTPQERTALFTPGQSAGSAQPGTGLGMAITKRIVQAHGGRVVVDTLAAQGTSILVVLPWKQPGQSEPHPQALPPGGGHV